MPPPGENEPDPSDEKVDLPPGESFEEWEAFKTSRAKQAKAAASEARPASAKEQPKPDEERRARQAEERDQVRKRERAEQRVQALEVEIKVLEARLADPSLYQQANGTKDAKKLDGELRAKRAELDRAMEEWSAL